MTIITKTYIAGEDISTGQYFVVRSSDGHLYLAKAEDKDGNVFQATADISKGQEVEIQFNDTSMTDGLTQKKAEARKVLAHLLGLDEESESVALFIELLIDAATLELAVVIDDMKSNSRG